MPSNWLKRNLSEVIVALAVAGAQLGQSNSPNQPSGLNHEPTNRLPDGLRPTADR
jgi:hypothetical protein